MSDGASALGIDRFRLALRLDGAGSTRQELAFLEGGMTVWHWVFYRGARLVRASWLKAVATWIIRLLAKVFAIDLVRAAHRLNGVLKFENDEVSGERFLIHQVLPRFLGSAEPTCFDVGANIGKHSSKLLDAFPRGTVYAFEPSPPTLAIHSKEVAGTTIIPVNAGFGSQAGRRVPYTYAGEPASKHATVYGNSLTELRNAAELIQFEFTELTVDEFCLQHHIEVLDFPRVDTEGCEIDVPHEAAQMLRENGIRVIQLEFNDLNVNSRVFLREFYETLRSYRIYRLDSQRPIQLPTHSPANNTFEFQNLVALGPGVPHESH